MKNLNSTCNSDRLRSTTIPVSVRVCKQKLRLNELLNWTPGATVSFDQSSTSRLTLSVGECDFGEGNAVKVGSHIGILVSRIGNAVKQH